MRFLTDVISVILNLVVNCPNQQISGKWAQNEVMKELHLTGEDK